MALITRSYVEQNRWLHRVYPSYGVGGAEWFPEVRNILDREGCRSVLDYGAGKRTLAPLIRDKYASVEVREYDPAVAEIADPPEPAQLVVCTDVLEHIEPECLDDVLADLRRVCAGYLFCMVSTKGAKKALPDGRNTHLTIQPANWWSGRLQDAHFVLLQIAQGHRDEESVFHAK